MQVGGESSGEEELCGQTTCHLSSYSQSFSVLGCLDRLCGVCICVCVCTCMCVLVYMYTHVHLYAVVFKKKWPLPTKGQVAVRPIKLGVPMEAFGSLQHGRMVVPDKTDLGYICIFMKLVFWWRGPQTWSFVFSSV